MDEVIREEADGMTGVNPIISIASHRTIFKTVS
jgi:hypothetical protein